MHTLAETLLEANKLADLADMYANDKEYRLAAINYSRAFGLVIAACEAAEAEGAAA